MHKGLMEGLIKFPGRVADVNNVTAEEPEKVEAEASETMKAALLISGNDRRCYGTWKDELANSYLLSSDQYPNTFDKATRILGNHQTSRPTLPYKPSRNGMRVAFLQ